MDSLSHSPARNPPSIRILIVEDQHILRDLLKDFFQRAEGFQVLGTCSNGEDALEKLPALLPDILLLDYQLPDISGLEVFKKARKLVGGLKIIFLSSLLDSERVRELTGAQVSGLVHKNISLSELAEGVRQVFLGGIFYRIDAVTKEPPPPVTSVDLSVLSEREQEVLKGIASGRLNKEIAYDINLSVRTVEKHRENIKRKLQVHDTASLVRIALEARMV